MVEADPPTKDLYQVLVIDPGFKRRWRSFKEKGAEYYCPISQPDLILESESYGKSQKNILDLQEILFQADSLQIKQEHFNVNRGWI